SCVLSTRLYLSTATAPTRVYPLSLHDALPISRDLPAVLPVFDHQHLFVGGMELVHAGVFAGGDFGPHQSRLDGAQQREHPFAPRSEEHTSELQSRFDLVCRLLLEKKKNTHKHN